jgi:hypothetical protein
MWQSPAGATGQYMHPIDDSFDAGHRSRTQQRELLCSKSRDISFEVQHPVIRDADPGELKMRAKPGFAVKGKLYRLDNPRVIRLTHQRFTA